MNKVKIISLTASMVLAAMFTFSCSSDGGESSGSVTYKGQTYRTVRIGGQVWFAENLNYAVGGSKCYDNLDSNCNTYGRLYDWSTAMGFASNCNSNSCSSQIQFMHKGICPDGWHIPSDAEWSVLEDYIVDVYLEDHIFDVYFDVTKLLKAKSGWNNDDNGTDDYGFSALPGGRGDYSGVSFYDVGDRGYWWSATEQEFNKDDMFAYLRNMNGGIRREPGYYYKSNLFSVRCVQD